MSKVNKKNILDSQKYIINADSNFSIVEAYNTARMNLLFTLATKTSKIVTFSSCSPEEGKSTSCVNMAITIAKTGAKVLIIDADMRKPTVNKLLNVSHTMGLSTVLGKLSSINDSIKYDVLPNIDVLIAGPIPPNPTELLSSDQLEKALNNVKDNYDIVIIDTPPINVVSDVLLFNKFIAGIIFVIGINQTSHNDLKKALHRIEFAEGNVLGFIKIANKK